jgi:hypothetical protein
MSEHQDTPELPSREQVEAEITNFDIMAPRPAEQVEAMGLNAKPMTKVTGLPPEHRGPILETLRIIPADQREAREAELVQEAVKSLALQSRMLNGPGQHVDDFQGEMWEVANEIREAEETIARIEAELKEVSHIDPQTREETLKHPEGSHPRHLREMELVQQRQRLGLLNGAEGERRLREARERAVDQRMAQLQQTADAAAVKRRAEEIARERRIESQAEALADFSSNVI